MNLALCVHTQITAYPGESVSFKVKVKDDLSLPTVGVFRFSHLTDLVRVYYTN